MQVGVDSISFHGDNVDQMMMRMMIMMMVMMMMMFRTVYHTFVDCSVLLCEGTCGLEPPPSPTHHVSAFPRFGGMAHGSDDDDSLLGLGAEAGEPAPPSRGRSHGQCASRRRERWRRGIRAFGSRIWLF